MNKNFLSRSQLDLLPERIQKAVETSATDQFYSIIWSVFQKKHFESLNILVAGDGENFITALFAKFAITQQIRASVEVSTLQSAFDTLHNNRIIMCSKQSHYDLVIAISYLGHSASIKRLAKLCKKQNCPFLLFTGVSKGALIPLYQEKKIVSFYNTDLSGKEKGKISMASVLIPCFILDDACCHGNRLVEKINTALNYGEHAFKEAVPIMGSMLKENNVIHVFYEQDTVPTAAYIEYIFAQSGLANVVLHEKRSFCHGRYSILYNQPFGMVINLIRCGYTDPADPYKLICKSKFDTHIAKFLRFICGSSAYYAEIGNSNYAVTKWNIESMFIIPYLVVSLGEAMGIDVAKDMQPFPMELIPILVYES